MKPHLISALCWIVLVAACDGDADSQEEDAGPAADGDVDSDSDSDGDGDADAGPEFPYPLENVAIEWAPCSLHEGEDDGRAECADVQFPLFWDAPDGETMSIRAKRLTAGDSATTQLWLLAGGPGASGTISYPNFMEDLQSRMPDLDVYTLDHRGTGFSSRLGCPVEESEDSSYGTNIVYGEMFDCLDYLELQVGGAMDAMTTTYSSIDLGALIHLTREPGKQVVVEGGSYGSYWAHRYLRLFPDQADGVVLIGIAPPDGTFLNFDENANNAAKRFMGVCGDDELCSSKLGDDPWATLTEVMDRLKEGHCEGLPLGYDNIRSLFAFVLYYYPNNSVVPAVIHRLDRCTERDIDAVMALYDATFGEGGTWDIEAYSILLQHHITFSEMWDHPDFADVVLEEYLQEVYETAYVAKNITQMKLQYSEIWPRYEDADHDDQWAETDTPMLMMHGKLDPATCWDEAIPLADHFTAPRQVFVSFEYAPHSTLTATPLSREEDTEHCSMRLFLDFLADPGAELDLSCVDKVLPPDFKGTPELAEKLLGTSDFWD